MAYLMEIHFDNSRRLRRKRYLFEYRGIRFKLVQDNPRRWADHLLSIVPTDERAARARVFAAAAEFLSALAWENRARVALWSAGGRGWRDDLPLQKAEPYCFTFPRIPFGGNVIGFELRRIPDIRTNEQRIALSLFREARASNSDYLSLLFFWQVLEVNGDRPESFINRAWRRRRERVRLEQSYIERLPLGGRRLGDYLLDNCRNAIAHIRRRAGRTTLDLDNLDERMRLAVSVHVVEAFAEHFIRDVLALTDLYLVRPGVRGFPVFVDSSQLRTGRFVRAYSGSRLHVRGMGHTSRRIR